MINKTILLFVVLLVSTLTLVSAESIGDFQLDVDDVEIYQTCNNCTGCNFTRVMAPNNQTILTNLVATQDGTYFYKNILKTNFTKNGLHTYCYSCGNVEESETGCINFGITYNGGDITEEQSSLYLISIMVLIFLFSICLFGINKLPTKDESDEEGTILKISNLKHLRPVLWGFCWGIILAILFIIGNATLAYLPSSMVGDLFMKLFIILLGVTMVALPLWFIWIFTGIFRDKEYKRMMERGVDLKTP